MSISYEEAISTLKVMFPDWDEETLSTVLVSNQYHVERTIENILSMCGDSDVSSNPAPAPIPVTQQSPQPSSAAHAPIPSVSSPNRAIAAPAPALNSKQDRGIKCTLPEDFLRPPGYQYRIFADEELALMLQNELFQREVRAMFGDDFIRQTAGRQQQSTPQGRPVPARQGSAATRNSFSGNAGTNTDPATASDGDMGIMKSLSSMGSAARRNLSMLAARFSSNQQQTRNGETGNAREFKPLVDGNNDDEDEVEFVSFDNNTNNRSRHVLQDTGETADSENPLIHRNM